MGQYFEVYNITKKEKINPMAFGDGNKIGELNKILQALKQLLSCQSDSPNEWAGDKIAIIGDECLYGEITEEDVTKYKDISEAVIFKYENKF